MDLYTIIRRNGWKTGAELEEAAERSTQVSNEMPDDIRWVRSYILDEGGGSFGSLCVFEASSPDAIRDHAKRAGLPVDEIVPVTDTVVAGPDPQPADV